MQLGTTVAGRFVLTAELGKGRFSDVYQASTIGTGTNVAVKVLRGVLDDSLTREVFEREVEALRELQHENVVGFLAHDLTDDGFPFIVTEFCQYPVEPARRWDDSAVEFTASLLRAAQQAHAVGIVHRDLKPPHLLRATPDGPIKVIDFGIAAIRRRMPTGITVGAHHTAGYACPDQVLGDQARPQFDLYAVAACVLWYLTGSHPSAEEPLAEQLRSAKTTMPAAFRDFVIGLTNVADSTLTAGVALRRLEELAQRWERTQDVQLILSRDVVLAAALEWGLSENERGTICERIAEDLALRGGSYPSVEAERDARDPAAFHSYSYSLVGRDYAWQLRVHPSGRAFVILRGERPSPDDLDARRQFGTSLPIDWYPIAGASPDPTSSEVQPLCAKLIGLKGERAAEQQAFRKRFALVDSWDSVLGLQRQFLDKPVGRAEYLAWEDRGEILSVQLADQSRAALWGASEKLSMTGRAGRDFVSVGALVGQEGRNVLINRGESCDVNTIAAVGSVAPDKGLQHAALRKQQDALAAVRKGTAVNPTLPAVLCGTSVPQAPFVVKPSAWLQADLDEPKKDAVCTALGTQDVVLIQGPPGTGKTVAIAELVSQVLSADPKSRILLVSQSNVALDQALERIANLNPQYPMARLARVEDKVSPFARDWMLSARTANWRSTVLTRSRAYLDSIELSPAQGVSVSGARALFEELIRLEERIAELGRARMPIMARLGGLSRGGDGSAASIEEARLELEIIDEEIREAREGRESAVELLSEFLVSRGVVVEGEPNSWADALQTVAASESLGPQSGLAALWDEWRRQFGRGLPYEAAYARRSRILAGTCLGSASHPAVSNGEFDWVIVDESGRATSPELLVPLLRGKRAVLVGDHHQLPPVLDHELSDTVLEAFGLTRRELEKSLFQQLFETLPAQHVVTLTTQFRMDPAIASLVGDVFYEGKLTTGERSAGFCPVWPDRRVTWLSTSQFENRRETSRGTSFVNQLEVDLTKGVLTRWREEARTAGASATVGVIAGYDEHRRALEWGLDLETPGRWAPLDVEVNTVDAFQGRERDLVIYNTVRSNPRAEVGFLSDWRRINVAFSRGREALVVIGDANMLRVASAPDGASPFRRVIEWIQTHPESALLVNHRGADS